MQCLENNFWQQILKQSPLHDQQDTSITEMSEVAKAMDGNCIRKKVLLCHQYLPRGTCLSIKSNMLITKLTNQALISRLSSGLPYAHLINIVLVFERDYLWNILKQLRESSQSLCTYH